MVESAFLPATEVMLRETLVRRDQRIKALQIRPPSFFRQYLERLGWVISPDELSSARSDLTKRDLLDQLWEIDSYLFGDVGAIGPGDDGKCQSWVGNPRWWLDVVDEKLLPDSFISPSVFLRLVAGKRTS